MSFLNQSSVTCDKLNYTAICVLEQLGFMAPTEAQIQAMEQLIAVYWPQSVA